MTTDAGIQEQSAALAFDEQAKEFDSLYGKDTIIRYKRQRVREHMEKILSPGSSILELNAGTGDDAVYFASEGHLVHATDISPEMQAKLKEKIEANGVVGSVSAEIISFNSLENLRAIGPYDHIFSNFAGLNCTERLDKVLQSFDRILKPGGKVTLVILPKFCLWEFLLLFKGKFKTAFRRFAGRKGAKAKINGLPFRCWYYDPSYVRKHLGSGFELLSLEGLCTLVPPSYIEGFAERRPKWFGRLKRWEERLKYSWPWRSIGDYYIISLKKGFSMNNEQ